MGDVNKTTHTGTAITNPSFTYLSNNTPMAIFTLKVRETWNTRAGAKQSRDNLLKFEALSKNAHWVKDNVQVGKRYYIDGYSRTDCINGVEDVKIRILHITEEENDDFEEGNRVGYRKGLAQCLSIVQNSDTLQSAELKLELLLQ